MKQPLLGVISTACVVMLALGIISINEHSFFMGDLSFAVMACIPTQIITAFVWAPLFDKMNPLAKGLSQTIISLLGGVVFGSLLHFVAGQGMGPTPQLMMLTIVTVIATFWLMVAWNAWPFAAFVSSPIPLGIIILGSAYLLAYLVFKLAFNYEFLSLAPIYIESLDPKGLFAAWPALAFLVTTVAVIMLCLLMDFYPLSNYQWEGFSAASANSVWILLLASLVFFLCVYIVKIDPVVYMVRGPVSFIFGAFILLNMLENSVFSERPQPLRGIVLALFAVVLAIVMQLIYQCVAQLLNPEISAGPMDYQLELWLANAMLAITFPLIVVMSDFFNLWPLRSQSNDIDTSN